ncbi:hypothetical protein ANN_01293 [Periplaneta americana]|uniref:Reverse transcriptase n=1 Tax=Periplaneta americana TaxID=6978 RepID=A0ABQ8TUZ0_PERAM|nr:hypothetical protein ANN_01293 [Periplaneta americana]
MVGLCEGDNEPAGSSKPFPTLNTRKQRATWEAYLQQLNINTKLENLNDQHVNVVRDYETIRNRCLSELQVSRDEATGSVKQLRQHLQYYRELKTWCANPQKGKGVVLFEEVPAANSWIIKNDGLSSSEWREMLKMTAMMAPVRSLPGRSTGTTHCRHCSEYETLPHVLGSCPQGEVLRIKRHNTIRSMIADALRSKNLDVHEEVHCIADGGSNRRIDIVAINRNKQSVEIIDPTIRFEISATQPSEVNEEEKEIYEPTTQYLSAKYNIEKITVTGLFFGARGTIPKTFVKWGKIQADERSSRCHRDNAGEMSPGSSTESYPTFARIGLRENPGKNLNQVTCSDRDSNPGHLVSQPDVLTVTPQSTDLDLSTALTYQQPAVCFKTETPDASRSRVFHKRDSEIVYDDEYDDVLCVGMASMRLFCVRVKRLGYDDRSMKTRVNSSWVILRMQFRKFSYSHEPVEPISW